MDEEETNHTVHTFGPTTTDPALKGISSNPKVLEILRLFVVRKSALVSGPALGRLQDMVCVMVAAAQCPL